MHILLINPPNCGRSIPEERFGIDSLKQIFRGEPLGLETLAGNLEGHDVTIIDLKADSKPLTAHLELLQPDLVGFTAMTHEVNRAAQAARLVRRALPGVKTVVGGPHATALPRRTLQESDAFDFAVVGEGEQTLLELLHALETPAPDFGRIQGLAWRSGPEAEIVVNETRPWIADLDALHDNFTGDRGT